VTEVLIIADLVVPAFVGAVLRRWTALAVVFVLWLGLLLFTALEWGLDSDDVPAEGFVLGALVIILVPAEVVAAGAVLLARRIRPRD
jgi:hypothetical protein